MRLDSLLLGEMEASLSVQPQEEEEEEEEGGSRIQSRDGSGGGGGGVGRGKSVSRARPSWFRRALGGLLMWKHPATVEPPALARERERAATERPRWRSSIKKAVGSALARVACVCEPVCSGVHDDDVVDLRKSRRRRRRSIRSGARSPPEAVLTGESDDYWTFAFRGRSSLTDEMLMRRFVLEEDAMRRRMEMRQAAGLSWFPPGPSRLSQMSLADDDDNGGGSNSSTSAQCSEAQSL